MPNKTLFISCFHSLISRNILQTPILSTLAGKGIRIVVLAPQYKVSYFQKLFGNENVVIEGVDIGGSIRTLRVGMLKRLAEALPNTERARLGRKLTLSGTRKNKIYYYFFYAPAAVLGKSKLVMKILRCIDYLMSPRGRFYALFEKYKPDLIFSTDVQNEHDVALMQDAYKKGIKTVGMVRSWDNLVTRAFRFVPETLVVHNEILRDQGSTLYGINPEKIIVTGVPHYDRYFKGEIIKRDAFFTQTKLDPSKKTILYFPLCDYRVVRKKDDNSDEAYMDRYILKILSEINANVIVRFSPNETVTIPGFVKPNNFYYDQPGYSFDKETVTNRDVTRADDDMLINELSFSDVIVTGPSTAAIDAAVFDKPIIFINFNSNKGNAEAGQIFEYASEHIINILKTGGTERAHSKEELISLIKEYFGNPSLNRAGRQKIVSRQCFKTDSKASERTAKAILEALSM